MAILEMIPREYWRQLYIELKFVWEKLESERIEQNKKEHERRSAEYDEAIKQKQKKAARISRSKPESKTKKKEYQKAYWAKKKQK